MRIGRHSPGAAIGRALAVGPVALAKGHSAASRLCAGLLAGFGRGHFVDSSKAARVLKTCSAYSRANCSCERLSRGVMPRSALSEGNGSLRIGDTGSML